MLLTGSVQRQEHAPGTLDEPWTPNPGRRYLALEGLPDQRKLYDFFGTGIESVRGIECCHIGRNDVRETLDCLPALVPALVRAAALSISSVAVLSISPVIWTCIR